MRLSTASKPGPVGGAQAQAKRAPSSSCRGVAVRQQGDVLPERRAERLPWNSLATRDAAMVGEIPMARGGREAGAVSSVVRASADARSYAA